MRILQINDDYQRRGGAETYFFNLIDLLKKKGHQVSIFAIRGQNTPKKGLLTTYFSSKIFNFKVYFKLRKLINQIKPDIIHLHNNYLAPFSVLLAIRSHQVIQTIHDYKIICPYGEMIRKSNLEVCQGNIGLKCLKNKCLSLHNLLISYLPFKFRIMVSKKTISRLISPSKKLKKYLENFGFENVQHLPYFLDVKTYQSKDTPVSGPDVTLGTLPEWTKKKGHILYLGRLVKTKGISLLFKALPKIISKVNQANLTVVGDGPQKDYLISLTEKLKITNKVNFAGSVPHQQIKKYYQQANVVVVPSICVDNSPNVVYEAFSAGRPVVASDRGGMSDFVKNGKTGFIFGPKDTSDGVLDPESGLLRGGEEKKKDLAKKIVIILKDDRLFKKMSLNCRQFAFANFTPEKHYQKIMRIYKNKVSS